MATIKYRKREFTPNQNQPGMTHCWYVESVIVNELDTIEISRLIEARTGVRRYEAQSVLASFVELINEECSQSMRIKLTDEKGQKFVSIYPKVSGSISDKEVQANPQKYEGRQTALESDLTADMLTVTLAATVGVNASKQFAKNSHIEKATALTNSVADEDEEENGSGGSNGSSGSSSSSGSQSQTSLTAPSISGTTPFTESTSVTMSGPSGAEIRYTTDGSTPTSSSSLYSSALSLSATTTVKAIAIKDGQSSEVTTKVFTKSGGGGDAD